MRVEPLLLEVGTSSTVLTFIAWIADRYQERTSRSFVGIRWGGIQRCTAIDMAWATFETALADGQLEGTPASWTQDDAIALADEDMHCWDVA